MQAALKQMQAMPLPKITLIGRFDQHPGLYLQRSRAQRSEHLHLEVSITTRTIRTRCSFAAICRTIGRQRRARPQFPGLPPNSVTLANSKGLAAGWTDVITPNLVSTLHYGFTRAGNQTTGVLTSNYEWFRSLSTPYGTSTGTARIIPVHLIGEDLSWNHGAHNIRFGGIFRYITNQSQSYANSYSSASSNPSWISGSGNDLLPASLGVSSAFKTELRIRHGGRAGTGSARHRGL